MGERPKVQATLSAFDNAIEDVACGCVMHRYKGYKTKRVSDLGIPFSID